jgi:HEAT repeat protein
MVAIIHVTLLAALLAADAGAPAASTRHDVEAALNKNPNPTELRQLAQTAEPTLIAIAGDRAASPSARGRSLAALAYARSGWAHAFLENFIIKTTPSREPADHVLLRRAAMALGWQSGPRLSEVLAPLLDSEDRDVRLDAAAALGLGHAHDAERPLRARLEVETDPAVRHEIQAALTAIGK